MKGCSGGEKKRGKRVLAIGAHPDDIEIGCGGTLAKLKDQGYELFFVVATFGEEGGSPPSKEDLKQAREQEAKNSAKVLGALNVSFLGLEDGLLSYCKKDKIKLIAKIRSIKPDIVFLHSSTDQFPDHKVIHSLSIDSVSAARGPWYAEAGGQPHFVGQVYGYEVWNPINQPSLSVNIEGYIQIKMDALREHRSQIKEVRYLEAVEGLAAYRGAMSMNGKFAEVFDVMQTQEVL